LIAWENLSENLCRLAKEILLEKYFENNIFAKDTYFLKMSGRQDSTVRCKFRKGGNDELRFFSAA
jgi:hypothetical protein